MNPGYAVDLLLNEAATGAAKAWRGGNGVVAYIGTFGGASLQLQMLGPDGVTWVNVGAAVTTAGIQSFALAAGPIRVTVTGGAPANLYARAARYDA